MRCYCAIHPEAQDTLTSKLMYFESVYSHQEHSHGIKLMTMLEHSDVRKPEGDHYGYL